MQLTVLGCAGSFPGPDSACSGYLVEHEGFRLLVDLGNGALGALQQVGGLYDVDAVVITHLHSDHCIDLVPWAVARRYGREPWPPVPVYGPAATATRIASAYLCPDGDLLADCYDHRVLTDAVREIGPFRVQSAQVCHPIDTFGLRISAGGKSLAYSADTGPCAALDRLAVGADLLLAEASFLDGTVNPPDLHLTGREAGECAQRADVGRLLLTHLAPWNPAERSLTEATAAFTGPVELARALATYQL